MGEATTTVRIECNQCGRLIGHQEVFPWFGPLPERLFQACLACEQQQAEIDAVLADAVADRRGRGAA